MSSSLKQRKPWAAAQGFTKVTRRFELVVCGHWLGQPLSDSRPQLLHPGQVRVLASLIRTVENLVPVQVHFQPTRIGWGQLDGNVTGVLRAPDLGRQPRGDGVVPSRHAVDDFYFNFPELCSRHNAP